MKKETEFDPRTLDRLFTPKGESKNGQIVIIGGSELFHGAPLLSLVTASRIVDMVFFSSPDSSVGDVANLLKSKLLSFIWVPWEEVADYVTEKKTNAVLIGPGLMRYRTERSQKENPSGDDDASGFTREITKKLLLGFPEQKWVIDAGSLQVIEPEWIPKRAILTPNKKEYIRLFGDMNIVDVSQRIGCTIILKGEVDQVASGGDLVEIKGGNAGMAKGGTGDTLAGLVVALYAKNDAKLSATSASYVVKKAGDELFRQVGTNFNADDLADAVPRVLYNLKKQKKVG